MPRLKLELSLNFSDDEVLNRKLDANANHPKLVYPSSAENRTNQYYTNETLNGLTAHGTDKILYLIHVNIRS